MKVAGDAEDVTEKSDAGDDDSAWAWSQFWHGDNFSACTPDLDASVEALSRHWRSFFATLKDGARVLDLGTGNGALAAEALAAGEERGCSFDVHGCDYAEIDPGKFVRTSKQDSSRITFHARTAMEDLPFLDQEFDAVCGQFALEYSDVTRSVPELLRVLHSGGRIQFLLHSEAGLVHSRNKLQWQQSQTLLESTLFDATRKMLSAVIKGEARNDPASLERGVSAIAALKETMDTLAVAMALDSDRVLSDNVFAAIRQLAPLRHRYDLSRLIALVDDIENRLKGLHRRLQSMLNAALSADGQKQLLACFLAANAERLNIRPATTGPNEALVGLWLTANKC